MSGRRRMRSKQGLKEKTKQVRKNKEIIEKSTAKKAPAKKAEAKKAPAKTKKPSKGSDSSD
jgi:hypothetical protein|tara:strand:+ start:743 stop:925 length:183 start_codon:yes stop_codon:yes gene_type:complete